MITSFGDEQRWFWWHPSENPRCISDRFQLAKISLHRIEQSKPNGYCHMVFSFMAHADFALLLNLSQKLKKFAKRLPSLEVVLVNAKTKECPKAMRMLIAQANLDRGGNTDLDRQDENGNLPSTKTYKGSRSDAYKKTSKRKQRAKATKVQAKQTSEKRKRVAELEKESTRAIDEA